MGEEIPDPHISSRWSVGGETGHSAKPKRRYWWWTGVFVLILGLVVLLVKKQSEALPGLGGDTLRWGGDAGGGAPFIIEEARDGKPGFEVELARYLAEKLGLREQLVRKE